MLEKVQVQHLTPAQLVGYRLSHVRAQDIMAMCNVSRATAFRLLHQLQPWQKTIIVCNGKRATYAPRSLILHLHLMRRKRGNPHCRHWDEHQVRAGHARQGGNYHEF